MDDQRVGRIVRALRRRLAWRQSDLARAAHCSQATVSLLERGRLERVSLPVVRRVIAALDASLVIQVHWRAGALERLLDEDHARLVGRVAALLSGVGWEAVIELTYSEYGERGSYDILAFHAASRALLVVEVKTDPPSAESTLRKLDEKARLSPRVARERFPWHAGVVARVLVMPDTSTLRRRTASHPMLFAGVLPARGRSIRRWLAAPIGTLAGIWFLSENEDTSHIRPRGGRQRVRRRDLPPLSDQPAD